MSANESYDTVVDTQLRKHNGQSFARVLIISILMMGEVRTVTPLGQHDDLFQGGFIWCRVSLPTCVPICFLPILSGNTTLKVFPKCVYREAGLLLLT